jgi:RNase P subunit RPR2
MAQARPELAPDLPASLRTETLAKGGWVDRDFVVQWLAEHWKERVCPACRQSRWGMLEQLVELPVGARVPVAPQEYPCVVVTCRNCGHMMFFSATRMGAVPSNVYLVSRGQMREVAAASTGETLWWVLAAAAGGLGTAFWVSGIMNGELFNSERALFSKILPLCFLLVFVIAFVAIFLERHRRRSMLEAIEEESKVPSESQIEASEMALN